MNYYNELLAHFDDLRLTNPNSAIGHRYYFIIDNNDNVLWARNPGILKTQDIKFAIAFFDYIYIPHRKDVNGNEIFEKYLNYHLIFEGDKIYYNDSDYSKRLRVYLYDSSEQIRIDYYFDGKPQGSLFRSESPQLFADAIKKLKA